MTTKENDLVSVGVIYKKKWGFSLFGKEDRTSIRKIIYSVILEFHDLSMKVQYYGFIGL